MKTRKKIPALLLILPALLALELSACDTQGRIFRDAGEPDPQGETFLIQSIQLSGSSLEPAAVSVDGLADEDGVDDLAWQTTFQLDDGSEAASLPADEGQEQNHVLRVKAVRSADGQEFHKKVTITLFE